MLTVQQPHCVGVRGLVSAANANEKLIPHPIFPRGSLLVLSTSLRLLSKCRFLLLVWIKAEV